MVLQLLRHNRWRDRKRYSRTMYVYNLPRLQTMNVSRLNKKHRSKWYPAETMTAADYADDLVLLANTPDQTKSLLHSLKQAAGGIGLNLNANKTEFMCFKQEGAISTLKFVDQFTYLGSNISSTESNVNIYIGKSWMAVNRLLIIWKSHISDKIRWEFFQAVVVSELLYGCTTWMLIKHIEKKLDGNYTRMLHAVLNKSWKQYLTKQQLYDHVPPILQAIQVRWTRRIGHYWRSKDKLTSEVLWWTLTYGHASVGCLARIYISSAWTLDAI